MLGDPAWAADIYFLKRVYVLNFKADISTSGSENLITDNIKLVQCMHDDSPLQSTAKIAADAAENDPSKVCCMGLAPYIALGSSGSAMPLATGAGPLVIRAIFVTRLGELGISKL